MWKNGTLCFIRSIVHRIVLLAFGTNLDLQKRIYYTDENSLIFQGYVIDICLTLRQWRFTSVNFNRNLLVMPTFIKQRKLICTPDNFGSMKDQIVLVLCWFHNVECIFIVTLVLDVHNRKHGTRIHDLKEKISISLYWYFSLTYTYISNFVFYRIIYFFVRLIFGSY